MKTHTVYRIFNTITKLSYIGVTSYPKYRKAEHFLMLRKGIHHSSKLQRAFQKYGRKVFKFQKMETRLTKRMAYEKEVVWIAFYDSYRNGYNMTEGGEIPLDAIPTIWNGIEYPSIKAAANACGISDVSMRRRIERGYTCDDDME